MVGHLPSMLEALGSILSINKQIKSNNLHHIYNVDE